jgi:hypothetical protein
MAIDPSDYDVVGLRELALSRDLRRSDDGSTTVAGSSPPLAEFAEPDRRSQWLGSHEERHKPYLRRVPRRDALRRVLREWLERLVARIGPGGAAEALAHYERVGWITESVGVELRAALPEGDGRDDGTVEDLRRIDHVHALSVVALAQLGAEGERPAAERADDPRSRPEPRRGPGSDDGRGPGNG